MSSFLDVPREVRDRIIELVLCSQTGTPYMETATEERVELDDFENRWQYARVKVKYAKQVHITSTSLLLVNHQVHVETVEAVNRLPSKRSYRLDVAVVNEEGLYPTWISVPSLSTRVDKVHSSFRVVGFLDQKGRQLFRGSSDGAPPAIGWTFYSLLERFLQYGPVGYRKSPTDKRISTKLLEIDLLTREDVHQSEKGRESRMVTVGDRQVLNSEYLAGWLSGFIGDLLGMSIYTAEYGAILYERVGIIKVMLDGHVKRQWDLAEELEKHQSAGESSNWKEQAYKERQAMRLPLMSTEGSNC